jgi:hypothetical protein
MVVFGDPAQLQTVTGRAGVRSVDPVTYSGPLSDIDFAAPRPEEKDRADAQDGVVVPGDQSA